MKPAALHPLEPERLIAVEKAKRLDGRLKANFLMASRILQETAGMPIAGFSLLDHQSQLFRNAMGDDIIQTDRDMSFCAYTILSDNPLVVEDLRAHENFYDHPMVVGDPHLNFYMGIAINAPGNLPIGALCAADHVRRRIDQKTRDMLDYLRVILENDLSMAADIERAGLAAR